MVNMKAFPDHGWRFGRAISAFYITIDDTNAIYETYFIENDSSSDDSTEYDETDEDNTAQGGTCGIKTCCSIVCCSIVCIVCCSIVFYQIITGRS